MEHFVHIVHSPEAGPIAVYDHDYHLSARTHANSISGAQVTPLPIRTSLPESVLDDLGSDFGDQDDTPVEAVSMEDIDDR